MQAECGNYCNTDFSSDPRGFECFTANIQYWPALLFFRRRHVTNIVGLVLHKDVQDGDLFLYFLFVILCRSFQQIIPRSNS